MYQMARQTSRGWSQFRFINLLFFTRLPCTILSASSDFRPMAQSRLCCCYRYEESLCSW